MVFPGCLGHATEGVPAGRFDGEDWTLEVNNSFIPHGYVSDDAGPEGKDQAESGGSIPNAAFGNLCHLSWRACLQGLCKVCRCELRRTCRLCI